MFSIQHKTACKAHWDAVGKPLNSLGTLENLVSQIGGIQHTNNVRLDKRAVIVLCADNGVVKEGVTQTDSSITALNAKSIANGTACINAFARGAHADVIAVDVGINTDEDCPKLLRRKAANGTKNIAEVPAMTRDEAQQTIQTGMELVRELKEQGYHILCTGEMGIGNTTTSSAMASALLKQSVESVTGRGAGLSDKGLEKKIQVIKQAIQLHKPHPEDALDVLTKLGGFDIAAMCGIFLGGEKYQMPIVIDGFISCVAALTAIRLSPGARDFMLASHVGREPACRTILEELGLSACITADLALGEGTGAVALLPLMDLTLNVYHQSSTFETLNMTAYSHFPESTV